MKKHALAVARALLWPGLFFACLTAVGTGLASGAPAVAFNTTYLLLAAALAVLERLMPYERQWLASDDQLLPDLLHTVLTKGFVQVVVLMTAVIGVADVLAAEGGVWWPRAWPLALQVTLGLLVAEFGLYWAHRLSHEWPILWRFHAVHHSVERLWFFNTGRFHVVDTVVSLAFGQILLMLAGAPRDVVIWTGAATAFIGILTHCNVDMRTGWLDYVFNTPRLHRWHHSRNPEEGNSNYGENLMIFDLLFGTFLRPERRSPVNIGIDGPMPRGFLGQLAQPFQRDGSEGLVAEPSVGRPSPP
ncbi:MAG: sterol desaturase family protein [Thalassobaculaceae bacterium]|nr:sterol desaturase family protein [Thalassobaculaceae bacterium]